MKTTPTVTLRVDRRCLVFGQPAPVGARVELPLTAALDAVETGRLSFVNADDRERCMAARRAEIARDLRRMPAEALGSPWMPARY